jgi:hypothetical protein
MQVLLQKDVAVSGSASVAVPGVVWKDANGLRPSAPAVDAAGQRGEAVVFKPYAEGVAFGDGGKGGSLMGEVA